MAITLDDPQVEALLAALVAVTGEAPSVAAAKAFEERLRSLRSCRSAGRERFLPEILELIEQGRRLPVLDSRSTRALLDDLWHDP